MLKPKKSSLQRGKGKPPSRHNNISKKEGTAMPSMSFYCVLCVETKKEQSMKRKRETTYQINISKKLRTAMPSMSFYCVLCVKTEKEQPSKREKQNHLADIITYQRKHTQLCLLCPSIVYYVLKPKNSSL